MIIYVVVKQAKVQQAIMWLGLWLDSGLIDTSIKAKSYLCLDLKNDTAEIMGKSVILNCTNAGHYCIPLFLRKKYLYFQLT